MNILFVGKWSVARYGSKVPLPYPGTESQEHGLRMFILQVYRINSKPFNGFDSYIT